jgi:hypothetical protein
MLVAAQVRNRPVLQPHVAVHERRLLARHARHLALHRLGSRLDPCPHVGLFLWRLLRAVAQGQVERAHDGENDQPDGQDPTRCACVFFDLVHPVLQRLGRTMVARDRNVKRAP